ncbi:hypothetical protein Dimus_023210 [Dionaea muscipula]
MENKQLSDAFQAMQSKSRGEKEIPEDWVEDRRRWSTGGWRETFLSSLRSLHPELCITAAYGNILPSKFLKIPAQGTVNIHPSLLPLYRGAAPVQRALQEGVKETGVSLAFTVRALDAGPIIGWERFSVDDHVKSFGTIFPCLNARRQPDDVKTPVEANKVQDAFSSIQDDKASRCDGYFTLFFKKMYLIGSKVTLAVEACNEQGRRGIIQDGFVSPYLFILAMECLSSKLDIVATSPRFKNLSNSLLPEFYKASKWKNRLKLGLIAAWQIGFNS